MRLKEKTHKKFVEFFEKMSKMHDGNEFELAYSDIQRETGSASVTLKRAIQMLEESKIIEVKPGRNSRYGRFKYLLERADKNTELIASEEPNSSQQIQLTQGKRILVEDFAAEINELTSIVDNLRRRIRNQEMAIALLQDRVAEIEDKFHKR